MDINAFDEFGFILWYHLPKAYDAYLTGKLRTTSSKIGSSPLFYFSKNHIESKQHNNNIFKYSTECYRHNRPEFTLNNWTPPPLKEKYLNDTFNFDKPILTIHNKNTIEWGRGIFNYFNNEVLEELLITFKDKYQIIYIRPPYDNKFNYQKDENQPYIDINDNKVLKEYNILSITDILETNPEYSYNLIQFMILANSDKHISPAGDAVIPSYFGGDVLIYNCNNCPSIDRGVWKTNSWLRHLSDANIYGVTDYNHLITKAKELWN